MNEAGITPQEKWCRSCHVAMTTMRETCPTCMSELVLHAPTMIKCPACGEDTDADRPTCQHCFASLDPADIGNEWADALARGQRLMRPNTVAPFAGGAHMGVERLSEHGALAIIGSTGFVEAYGTGNAHTEPLIIADVKGPPLLRLVPYQPVANALVAFDSNDNPVGTYLRNGPLGAAYLDVRDEATAPAARLRIGHRPSTYELVETGAGVLGVVTVNTVYFKTAIDDSWTFSPGNDHIPLPFLGLVGMIVAAKLLLGRATPEPRLRDDHRRAVKGLLDPGGRSLWGDLFSSDDV